MAVAHVATGAVAAGTTSCTPAYPAGISAGNGLWLGVGACDPTVVTFPAISGWTKLFDVSLGGGVHGAGTGPRRVGLYRKDVVLGTETGTVTVTPTGGSDVCQGAITCWSVAAGKIFDVIYETGQDAAAGSAISITAGSLIGETVNDYMVGLVVAPANANLSSQTFTATGVTTYGTALEHIDTGSNLGDDDRLSWMSRGLITAGTATAATVYSSTATGTAGCVFLRLREADPPATLLVQSRQLWLPRASRQRATYSS